jgi:hypothetical protein
VNTPNQDGVYLYWAHDCQPPSGRDEPAGTLWQCPNCPRIWRGDERYWIRVWAWTRPWLRWRHRRHHQPVPPADPEVTE